MAEKMSNAEYRAKEGISSTDLKRMVKSPAYYKYCLDNPNENDSPSLLFGRAVHKWVLEPSDFYEEFVVAKDFNCGNKEGKQAYAEYVEGFIGRKLTDAEKKYKDAMTSALMSCGKDVITESEFEKIQKMRDSIYATPFARQLLMGQHEESFFWTDERTGLPMKCRPDSFSKMGNEYVIVDLKTCASAENSRFMRSAIDLNYDLQASHYCEGLKACTGHDYKFVFVAVEKEPPFLVNILVADEYFMQSGKEVRESMIDLYKKCIEKNEWCGYLGFSDEADLNELSVYKWMRNAIDSDGGID